jgi:hypothetical protein
MLARKSGRGEEVRRRTSPVGCRRSGLEGKIECDKLGNVQCCIQVWVIFDNQKFFSSLFIVLFWGSGRKNPEI